MSSLHIDWTRCEGRGGCVDLLPELMDRDEHGYPVTTTNTPIPPELAAPARQAVRDCPRLALRLDPT